MNTERRVDREDVRPAPTGRLRLITARPPAERRVLSLRRTASRDFSRKAVAELCNGSTYDSDSYCLGSNPSSPAFLFLAPLSRGLGRGPLKAETRVRIPSELLFYALANQRFASFFMPKTK